MQAGHGGGVRPVAGHVPHRQIHHLGTERLQLIGVVDGSPFRAVGDVDQPRLHHVLAVVAVDARLDQRRTQLAVRRGDRQHLVAAGLDGAGLVRGDMAAGRRDHRFVRTEESRQRDEVGLGAAGQEMDVGVTTQAVADQRGGACAVDIETIASVDLGARDGQRLQQAWMPTLAVVVAQADPGVVCGDLHHRPFAASATARNSARPLFIVSSHSFSGSES